ncbi:MAG: hypothetical protein AB3N09_04310 [Tateyamaria sp.]
MAWDICKLVAATDHLVPQMVPLAEIAELDEDWWFAHGTVPTPRALAEHMKLVSNVDRTHPIILDADGRLMDGMHRVVQALLDGETTIAAIRLPETPPPDYIGIDPDDLPYDAE